MLNNVRLKVEEESEISLELLRLVRRQQQEVRLRVEEQSEMSLELLSIGVDAAMDLEEKNQVFNVAGEELSAVKQKLMLLD
nr:hypothetical protein [Tanacetum cinerariifolium]